MKGIKMKRGRKSRVNKLLVALIAVMMVAVYGVAPIQAVTGVAFAEEADFTVKDGVITGYTGQDEDVVIPETIDGVTITAIDKCTFDNSMSNVAKGDGITSITILATISSIGDEAFVRIFILKKLFLRDPYQQ